MADPESLLDVSFIPGIGAAFLSVYNWFQLRRGPKLVPNEFVNYGYFAAGQWKYLYLPILVDNNGTRTGLVSDINIFFGDEDSREEIEIKRRVELQMDADRTGRSPNPDMRDYKEQVPMLPVSIPADSGEFIILECYDSGENGGCVPVDKEMLCTIEITYQKKTSRVEFPFKLRSEDIKNAVGIIWLRP